MEENQKAQSGRAVDAHTDNNGIHYLKGDGFHLSCNKVTAYMRPHDSKLGIAQMELVEPVCNSTCPDFNLTDGQVTRTCGHFPVVHKIVNTTHDSKLSILKN